MSPVSRFTKEGLPEIAGGKAHSDSPGKTPRNFPWPVYVKTKQKEFNYPEGEANSYTRIPRTGGIQMGSLLRRLLIAWLVGDLAKVPFFR